MQQLYLVRFLNWLLVRIGETQVEKVIIAGTGSPDSGKH